MNPRDYRQWTPLVTKGGRAIPGLGLFVNIDPKSAKKAVPIIGGGDKEKPAPKLEIPGATAPKPGAKILSPGAPQNPGGKLVTPGGLVNPSGKPVSAPENPGVFLGSTPKPKIEAPSAPKLGGGLVAPGPQPNPKAKLITPGSETPKTSGSLVRTPHDKPMQPTKQLVDLQGRPASSHLTEGPGAAKPTPKLVAPGSESSKPSGPLVKPTVVGGQGKQQTAGAEAVQKLDQQKKEAQAKVQPQDGSGGPQQPGKPLAAAGKPEKGKPEKKKTAGPRISGPNIAGGIAQGAMYSNLAAPMSAAAMDAAGALQGLTSTGTRHERDRDSRTGIAQRHEMVRQGDMAARSQQSSMLKRSQTAREDSVRVRPGLRLYVNG